MSKLREANFLFKKGDYEEAVRLYSSVLLESSFLKKHLDFNINIAEKRLSSNINNKKNHSLRKSLMSKDASLYEGRLEKNENGRFVGWAVNKENKNLIIELDVFLDGVFFSREKTEKKRMDLIRHGKSSGYGGFDFFIPIDLFDQPKHCLEILFPDGRELAKINLTGKERKNDLISFGSLVDNPVSIIVPIYNALDDLKICIDRLRKHTKSNVDIILINDASSDFGVNDYLENFDFPENFRVFHNQENMGFTKTVNRGMKIAGENDVVLLNSDARVTPRWLEGLRRALVRDALIATVTPISDRAGAFSAPKIGNNNNLPAGVSEEDFAIAFRRRSLGYYPTVPTGNGFCMYIRRSAIKDIGALDEIAFPKGYGEENDFCMRARERGWRNIIDDRTYVFHDRNKSFGSQKDVLITEGRAVVNNRYPDYSKAIGFFSNDERMKSIRYQAEKALIDCNKKILPRVLYVISTITGGTPQTNRDLMLSLSEVVEPWLFRCDSREMTLWKVSDDGDQVVESYILSEKVEPLTHRSHEYDRIISLWLDKYDFEIVHIRHLAWHSLSLPWIAKWHGAKVIKSFHDFYTVCPTIKLIDSSGNYCQGQCSKVDGKDCEIKLWEKDSLPELKSKWVMRWRENFNQALEFCDAFVTTSESAKKTINNSLSLPKSINFEVIEHGRDFSLFRKPVFDKKIFKPIKILFPGNIDMEKGLNFIKDLLDIDTSEILEIHTLGNLAGGFKHSRVINHGSYKREDFLNYIEKINPDIGAVFSIWDETWCHTLTELWSAGVPVMVFEYPTVANRVRRSGAGWVVKSDVTEIYDSILNIINNQSGYFSVLKKVEEWQKNIGAFNNNRFMSIRYLNLYKGNSGSDLNSFVSVVCPSNERLNCAPASTYVRVWERTKNSLDRKTTYLRQNIDQLIAGIECGFVKNAILQRTVISQEIWPILKGYVKEGRFNYIYEIDDNLLDVPVDKDSSGFYKSYSLVIKDIIENASKVIVSDFPLRDRLSYLNESMVVVENKLSFDCFGYRDKIRDDRLIKDSFNIIYYGSYTHEKDLQLVIPALNRLYQENKNFKLIILGVVKDSLDYPFIRKIEIKDGFKEYPFFIQLLKSTSSFCSVGIAPLKNELFNNFKSDLKVLEYKALGLPCFASNFGPYSKYKDVDGVVLVNDGEWYSYFKMIMEDDGFLRKIKPGSMSSSDYVDHIGYDHIVEN